MPFWCGIIGCIIFVTVFYDITWTILSAAQSGPLTLFVTRVFRTIARAFRNHDRILQALGILTFLTTIIIWYSLIWTAWVFIFLTKRNGILRTVTGDSATIVEVIYFSGYTIFTLGIGDIIPMTTTYMLLTALCCASGFFMVSITAAYLLSASAAIIAQRQFAGHMSTIGKTCEDIIVNAWNPESGDLKSLDWYLQRYAREIVNGAEMLLMYPIICNFHSPDIVYSSFIKVVVLDELANIIEYSIPSKGAISHLTLIHLRHAIDQYLKVLQIIHMLQPSRNVPSLPRLSKLTENGIPVLGFPHDCPKWNSDALKERRKLLKGLVKLSGRHWRDCI